MFSGWVYVGTVLWCHRSWSKGNGDIRAVIHIERFLFPPFFTKAFTLPIHRMLVWHFSFGERTIVLVGRHISSLPSFLGYSDLVGFPLSLQYGIHSGHEGHLIWGKKKKKSTMNQIRFRHFLCWVITPMYYVKDLSNRYRIWLLPFPCPGLNSFQ